MLTLRIRQVILLKVNGRIEYDLRRVAAVFRPVDLVVRPHGVRVSGVYE